MISVKDHGAKGDGTTDDAASIQAAINAGGSNEEIYFPGGTYKVGSTLNLHGGIRMVGASRATQLLAAMTGDLIQVSGSHSAISHLGFGSVIPNRTGAYVRNWHDPKNVGAFLMISDCHFEFGYDHIAVDFPEDLYLVDCTLEQFSHCGVVLGLYGSGFPNSQPGNTYISRCEIASGIAGATAGIYVKQSGGLFISQVDIYGADTMLDGINLDPAPGVTEIAWTFLDQVQCDSCARDGLTANGSGVVRGLFCSNSWFATNRNIGVQLGFSNTVSGVQLNGCQIVNNGATGINLEQHVNQVAITGCLISGNGRLVQASGINFAPGISDIVITGSVVGPMAGFGNTQHYGITFNGPVNRCLVASNILSNNSGGSLNGNTPAGVTWNGNV